MEKQTAVNYFKDELIKKGFFVPGGIYAQAKEIEKEQIISAVIFGVEQLSDSGDLENENKAEQYYNETYN
jgi:hypothetical protein